MATRPGTARRYVAFLRAINVGGHTVRMDRLRQLFEEIGFGDVATFIASGNVIFDARVADERKIEQKVEEHLARTLGYEVATFVRATTTLDEIAAYDPFPSQPWQERGHSLYVMFLQSQPGAAAVKSVVALNNDVDRLHVHERELYWLSSTTMSQATITGAQIERTLGMPGTIRNVTTVRKLAAKLAADTTTRR